jgi:hypothetical protein
MIGGDMLDNFKSVLPQLLLIAGLVREVVQTIKPAYQTWVIQWQGKPVEVQAYIDKLLVIVFSFLGVFLAGLYSTDLGIPAWLGFVAMGALVSIGSQFIQVILTFVTKIKS